MVLMLGIFRIKGELSMDDIKKAAERTGSSV